ncbi:unnamed protein product [Urochloa decumbens]|uniref:F-box domain-containing protein n=1 Tax=Urochloa decumbens TaxID=240449 RepID=A0ABC8ZT53_9POAL
MALESGGGAAATRAKRRRADEQGKDVAEGPEAAPACHISALPDDLRRRILTHLPLKDAIRSGALARGWRDLWKSRWADPTSSRDIHLLPGDNPRKVLESLESVPRRRLDRFSFVSDREKLRQPHLKRFLAYAAGCRVEDLRVDLSRCHGRLTFHLPLSSPLLAHLSLRNVDICHMYYKRARPFYALESIHLHSVKNTSVKFSKVMEFCPRLHTLDLRRCHFSGMLCGANACGPVMPNLRRITVEECYSGEVTRGAVPLNLPAPSLRSFRYSGRFLDCFFCLANNAALTDLYICFENTIFPDPQPIGHLSFYFPRDLTGLSVLTISSNDVRIVCSVFNMRATSEWTKKMNNLRSLRELQLLMLGIEKDSLVNIGLFLKACNCSNLERLFVQLPATSDVPLEDLVEEAQVLPPEDVIANLRMVKVMNFNWRRFEVILVSLLLRKATSLHKLLLVSPNINPQHVPDVQEADLSLLKEALACGRIIVSKSDDLATQPFHSEVFIKV